MSIFYFFVMAGLVPAIHVFVRYTRRLGVVEGPNRMRVAMPTLRCRKYVDARDKPGHDGA